MKGGGGRAFLPRGQLAEASARQNEPARRRSRSATPNQSSVGAASYPAHQRSTTAARRVEAQAARAYGGVARKGAATACSRRCRRCRVTLLTTAKTSVAARAPVPACPGQLCSRPCRALPHASSLSPSTLPPSSAHSSTAAPPQHPLSIAPHALTPPAQRQHGLETHAPSPRPVQRPGAPSSGPTPTATALGLISSP
jgi:hypothetical protein